MDGCNTSYTTLAAASPEGCLWRLPSWSASHILIPRPPSHHMYMERTWAAFLPSLRDTSSWPSANRSAIVTPLLTPPALPSGASRSAARVAARMTALRMAPPARSKRSPSSRQSTSSAAAVEGGGGGLRADGGQRGVEGRKDQVRAA